MPDLRAERAEQLRARHRLVPASGPSVPSPCISVCRIHADHGYCEGCFRTMAEISGWYRAGPDRQRAAWPVLMARMEKHAG